MKKQLKSMPRRVLLMLLAGIASATALAKGTKIGDLNYILDNTNRTAWVTYETESGPYYTNLPANLTIPSSVTYLDITYKVTMIDTGAFMGCTGMTSVTIPPSVKQTGENAFVDCGNLISVTCNAPAPPACGGNVFTNSANATLIVPSPALNAYRSTSPWSSFGKIISFTSGDICYNLDEDNRTASVTFETTSTPRYSNLPSAVTIPEKVTYNGETTYTVTSIGHFAFYGCTGLNSVSIPSSVTLIDTEAFGGCTSLTSVTIPESVTEIGWGAFAGCTGLKSIDIPDRVASIGNMAFEGCTGLTSVTIPSSVAQMGSQTF